MQGNLNSAARWVTLTYGGVHFLNRYLTVDGTHANVAIGASLIFFFFALLSLWLEGRN